MFCRTVSRLGLLVVLMGLVVSVTAASGQDDSSRRGRKYKAPPATARIEVTILKDVNGKPIENAAVIFHPMEGEKDKGNMELKTDEDGKTIIDVMPIGDMVRLQVIARGFQTFGEDFKIDKEKMAIEIRMKRPGEQYSIYQNHSTTPDGGKSTVTDPGTTPAPGKPGESAPPQPQASPAQPK